MYAPSHYNSLALHPRLPSPVTTRPVPSKLPKLHLKNSSCYVGPLTNLLRQKLCPDRPLGALPSLTYHFDSPLWTGYGMEMRLREWIYRSLSLYLTHTPMQLLCLAVRDEGDQPLVLVLVLYIQPTKSKPAWCYFRISMAE